jgi:hypothetical protein
MRAPCVRRERRDCISLLVTELLTEPRDRWRVELKDGPPSASLPVPVRERSGRVGAVDEDAASDARRDAASLLPPSSLAAASVAASVTTAPLHAPPSPVPKSAEVAGDASLVTVLS